MGKIDIKLDENSFLPLEHSDVDIVNEKSRGRFYNLQIT